MIYDTAEKAKTINEKQDLSKVRITLNDEIFQSSNPVLTGMDNDSTYCYLLKNVEHRDKETWGYYFLELSQKQKLNPKYTIADFGKGLRGGQKLAWPNIPCHGDIFHIKRQYYKMILSLERLSIKAIKARSTIENQITKINKRDPNFKELCEKLIVALEKADSPYLKRLQIRRANQEEEAILQLYDDLNTLMDWLSNDILSLAGADYNERVELFNFVLEELKLREELCRHRIRPVRIALENQGKDLLAFAKILDNKLSEIACNFEVNLDTVREILYLHKIPQANLAYWKIYNQFYQKLGDKFYFLFESITQAMKETPRASSMVENLNSRLRNYFFLRKQLGQEYLDLLQFFLNHRTFMRSEHPERVGKSPTELLTGVKPPHWLELLGFERFKRATITA